MPEAIPYDVPPIDTAIEAGWVQILDNIDYLAGVLTEESPLQRWEEVKKVS